MKLHFSLAGAAAIGLSCSLPVRAASFDLTQISPVNTVNSSGLYSRYGNASINNASAITYEAFQGSCGSLGGNCVVTGFNTPPYAILSTSADGSTATIADISKIAGADGFSGFFDSGVFFSASTNNAGTTVLAASGYNSQNPYLGGPTAILTGSGGPVNTVIANSTPFSIAPIDPSLPFGNGNLAGVGEFVSGPGINDLGTTVGYGGTGGTIGLYTASSDGTITKIADDTGKLKNFQVGLNVGRGQGPFAVYSLPSINNAGEVAFGANLKDGGSGIFTSNGDGNLTAIADTSGGFTYFSSASLNQLGEVAFDAGLPDDGSGIFISKDGKLNTVAASGDSSIFKHFTSDVAFNDLGEVAFDADLNGGGNAIFTEGSDSIPHQVIAVGDALAGSTVRTLFVSHEGLNDAGDLAFDALLADGSQRVFRATTVPQSVSGAISVPESGSEGGLFGIAILGAIGHGWRRWAGDRT